MNKLIFALAIFSILSFGFVANSHAIPTDQNGLTIYDATKLIGTMVKDRNGVPLGNIYDLVMTSQGNVDFAIVNQVLPKGAEVDYNYWHTVAVPLSVLTIKEGKSQKLKVVFNADKEKFYEAPFAPLSFLQSRGRVDPHKVAELDRYFGVQPPWTCPFYY
jgi:hypothetical protein